MSRHSCVERDFRESTRDSWCESICGYVEVVDIVVVVAGGIALPTGYNLEEVHFLSSSGIFF